MRSDVHVVSSCLAWGVLGEFSYKPIRVKDTPSSTGGSGGSSGKAVSIFSICEITTSRSRSSESEDARRSSGLWIPEFIIGTCFLSLAELTAFSLMSGGRFSKRNVLSHVVVVSICLLIIYKKCVFKHVFITRIAKLFGLQSASRNFDLF